MKYPEPTVDEPTLGELEEMFFTEYITATDGCPIEPDGICEHGHPSWLIVFGLF